MIISILAIVALLLLSAFFSGSETALFSLNILELRKLEKKGKNVSCIKQLLSNPVQLLATILIGNIIVNITASVLATSIAIRILGNYAIGSAIGVMTLLLLLFGEVTPKSIAIENSVKFSLISAKPLLIFSKIILPLRWCLKKTTESLIPVWVKPHKREPTLTEEELKTMLDVGQKEGIVHDQEREMIRAVLEFTDTDVKEVQTPRVDIKAISMEEEQDEALQLVKEFKHSIIPVYKETIDKVLGVIYTKELFLNQKKSFISLVKPVLFVPETKKIDELMEIFQKQKLKMAIAVDEHGGTAGLVTLEDILEEIFGEIYDEYETPEDRIQELDNGMYSVSGKIAINDVNEALGINLPEEEHETLAGLLLDRLGKIPTKGESIKIEDITLAVERIAARRIIRILINTK